MLFSYLSPSHNWASWGLLVISTSVIVYLETQLRAEAYLASDKSFFDYWTNSSCLLFQSVIASCSSWVSFRQVCITKYRMGFPYSGVSNSVPILATLHKTHNTYWSNDHMQFFRYLRPLSDHWGEFLSNLSAQMRHITYLVSLKWADWGVFLASINLLHMPFPSSEILFPSAPSWIIIKY